MVIAKSGIFHIVAKNAFYDWAVCFSSFFIMNCKHVKNLKLVLNGYVIIHLFCFGFFLSYYKAFTL